MGRPFHRIGDGRCAARSPVNAGKPEAVGDHFRRNEWARSIVNCHKPRACRVHGLQPVPHREVPLSSTFYDPGKFRQALLFNQLLDFFGAVFASDDD